MFEGFLEEFCGRILDVVLAREVRQLGSLGSYATLCEV